MLDLNVNTALTILYFFQIEWDNRLPDYDPQSNRLVTVDGTHFRVQEQKDNPRSWYSFKFRSAAVCYELAIGIFTGKIVWTSGPWRAGSYPDITIFRNGGLRDRLLEENEKAVADKGYRGEPDAVDLPHEGSKRHQFYKSHARARHEQCNKRLKQFGCLVQRFRHKVDFHCHCFNAVVILTELAIENGKELWDVLE